MPPHADQKDTNPGDRRIVNKAACDIDSSVYSLLADALTDLILDNAFLQVRPVEFVQPTQTTSWIKYIGDTYCDGNVGMVIGNSFECGGTAIGNIAIKWSTFVAEVSLDSLVWKLYSQILNGRRRDEIYLLRSAGVWFFISNFIL